MARTSRVATAKMTALVRRQRCSRPARMSVRTFEATVSSISSRASRFGSYRMILAAATQPLSAPRATIGLRPPAVTNND